MTSTAGASAMVRPGAARPIAALAALALAAGCDLARRPPPAALPPPIASAPAARPAPATPAPDPLVAFYADMEGQLTASGRMRPDTAPPDAPFTADDLARNFERIALYDEYVDVDGQLMHRETIALLRRWDRPVRVGVVVGPSVPSDMAARHRAEVADFTARLARLTGLDIRLTDEPDVNFLVTILSTAEQAVAAETTARQFPNFRPAVLEALRATPLEISCIAYAFDETSHPSAYASVLILIRAEHPPLTRLSCIHEEMAQAMGLPNDSPDARPSLFNGSLEFAFLTEHDEILLRMLYDPRLRPGMTLEEARPLLPEIARDAMAAQAASRSLTSLPIN